MNLKKKAFNKRKKKLKSDLGHETMITVQKE
jgi:hypothetical protein